MNRLWTATSAGRPDRTRRRECSTIRPELLIENAALYHGSNASLLGRSPAWEPPNVVMHGELDAARGEGASPPVTSLPSRAVPAGQCGPVASKMARLWQSVSLSAWQAETPRSCGTRPGARYDCLWSRSRLMAIAELENDERPILGCDRYASATRAATETGRVHRPAQCANTCCSAGATNICSGPIPSHT